MLVSIFEWPIIPEWLLALSLTLFILDIFLLTELISWGGIVSLALYLTWRIDLQLKWSILLFLVLLVVISIVYYLGFKSFIGELVKKAFLKGSPDEVVDKINGSRGIVHFVSGRAMFKWNGDELFPIVTDDDSIKDGDLVSVVNFSDGCVKVQRV